MAVRRVTISQEIGELRDCGILAINGRWNLSAGRVRWKSVRFQLNMVSVDERRYDKIAGIMSFSSSLALLALYNTQSSLSELLIIGKSALNTIYDTPCFEPPSTTSFHANRPNDLPSDQRRQQW